MATTERQFIRNNFKTKECKHFILKKEEPESINTSNDKKKKKEATRCHCGGSRKNHKTNSSGEDVKEWDEKTCIEKKSSTDFGQIKFEEMDGKKLAKFVRVCHEDKAIKCIELMTKYWNITVPTKPRLAISVVGGAKNFKLDSRMRDIFNVELLKAAKTTNAWLITSGFNIGVMKAVGQAVHEGQTFQWHQNKLFPVLRCIGIGPWGYVKDRKTLESKGKENISYRSSNKIKHGRPVSLNPDHTHFILVDNGHRNKYEGVANFRSNFEKEIQTKESGLGVSLVLLLIEGGTDAIDDVHSSLKKGNPVVVCAGTGRAADILAYAYKIKNDSKMKSKVQVEIRKSFSDKEEVKIEQATKAVIDCCHQKDGDLMVIYNINKHEDLSSAILEALFKAKKSKEFNWDQLHLALYFDRANIAQEKLFTEDNNLHLEETENVARLNEIFTEALKENKIEFIKLLLNNGIVIQHYVTNKRINELFCLRNDLQVFSILKLADKSNVLNEIRDFLKFIAIGLFNEKTGEEKLNKGDVINGNKNKEAVEESEYENPFELLLIWALFTERFQLAELFWELGSEPITTALMCTNICKHITDKLPKYLISLNEVYTNIKDMFEKHAISILNECFNDNQEKAMNLLQRKSTICNNLTGIEIAASASDQAFVSSLACQTYINNVWKNGIIEGWPVVTLAAVFPPYIFWLDNRQRKQKSKFKILANFYSAPLTKFAFYNISYVAFLALFTFMLLADFNEIAAVSEWIIFIWVISYLIGIKPSFHGVSQKLLSGQFFKDNIGAIIDVLNLCLAITAFIVHWKNIYDAKVIYCINAIVFYVRVMKLYTANRKLGPKINMIYQMLFELVMFVMVLIVFLMAYGVANQGLLYKHRHKDWYILKDIFYLPYWQLFGELYLEDLDTDSNCKSHLLSSLNMTGNLPDELNTCRTFHWLSPLLLALYLLVGNILLLNLLIAIFSHIFINVERNATEIWKFEMYFLVMEFKNRPELFPPFNILSQIYYIFRYLWHLLEKRLGRKNSVSEVSDESGDIYLNLFEKERMSNKLRALKANKAQSLEVKLNILQSRITELMTVTEEILDCVNKSDQSPKNM